MSKSQTSKKKQPKQKKKQAGFIGDLADFVTHAIDEADEQAAAARVSSRREQQPDATNEELVEQLIKSKCYQTAMIGAVTSGSSLVPGLGTVASLTFGVAADIGMTFKLQAELVLEIAAVYGRQLSDTEKRSAVLLVTGISAGASQILRKAGQEFAKQASERLAEKAVLKSIPVLGIAASGVANFIMTYIVGQRAQDYFTLGPESVEDFGESIRAIVGLDERKLISWLTEATENAWQLVNGSIHRTADAVLVAGKSAGELVVVKAGEAGDAVSRLVSNTGKGIAAGAQTASDAVVGTGRKMKDGAAQGVGAAAQAMNDAKKRVGQTVADGVEKAGDLAVSAKKSIDAGAEATGRTIAETGRKVKDSSAAGAAKAGKLAADTGERLTGALKRNKISTDQLDTYNSAEENTTEPNEVE
jgi:hypothetical protein